MSLTDAVGEGRLAGLYALRDALAAEIESPSEAKQVAALARQLRETLAEVEKLEREQPKESVVDDLAARRKNRRAAAQGVAEAAGSHGK